MPSLFDSPWGRTAFLNSLFWRRPDGCSEDTRRQFETLLANPDAPSPRQVFDTLLSLAAIPEHPLNASFMHELLWKWPRPDRDARWSIYLHEAYAYGEDGPVNRLLDWAGEQSAEARDSLEGDVVDSIATAFAWMLTASNRFVRDRASKGSRLASERPHRLAGAAARTIRGHRRPLRGRASLCRRVRGRHTLPRS